MPSYVYACDCDNRAEVAHSIHDEPAVNCGKCGNSMKRIPQGAAVQFKAGGFYSVDSKKSQP